MSPDHETRVDTGLDSKRLSRFCIGSVSFSGKGRSSVWARPSVEELRRFRSAPC